MQPNLKMPPACCHGRLLVLATNSGHWGSLVDVLKVSSHEPQLMPISFVKIFVCSDKKVGRPDYKDLGFFDHILLINHSV